MKWFKSSLALLFTIWIFGFIYLSLDRSAEGVPAGGQVHAGVHVLEHHGVVPGPVVALAHHRPHVARVPAPALAERRNFLQIYKQTFTQRHTVILAQI